MNDTSVIGQYEEKRVKFNLFGHNKQLSSNAKFPKVFQYFVNRCRGEPHVSCNICKAER